MSKAIKKEILICPNCRSDKLSTCKDIIVCERCGNKYKYLNGKYLFFELTKDDVNDLFDKIKYTFKGYSKFYNFIKYLISPVYVDKHLKIFLKENVEGKDIIALNLGCGNSNISNNVSNLDIFPYDTVDLACDIANLPFRDNSVDIIINVVLLEHISDPEKVVNEFYRVLKKEGIVYSVFPFIQGFHASPNDFSRRTYEGMKVLYKDFDLIELKCTGGPTSALLWVFQEWIALLFSFGIKPLHTIVYIIIMILTFPIKFLDILLIKHPFAKNISSSFTYVGKKGGESC